MNIDEKIMKEIEIGAKHLAITTEEMVNKYVEICEENGVDVNSDVAVALLRNYVRGNMKRTTTNNSSGSNSLVKSAFGFFVSLESPRDMMSWSRNKAKEEYLRDNDKALSDGLVAVATENDDGTYTLARYYKGDYAEKMVKTLNAGAEELEDGSIIIPIDPMPNYPSGLENKRYGKPLPVNEFRRSGIFYGSIDGGEMKSYYFSYKNQGGVDFTPDTFDWVHFKAIPSDDGLNLYGFTSATKDSLIRNEDVNPDNSDYRDMSSFDFSACLFENYPNYGTTLVDLDRLHQTQQMEQARDKIAIVEGTVVNQRMTPTANGNRIISITDKAADMELTEDDDGDLATTCWIPEHININFGIGSKVIVVGRTSQRIIDGEAEPITINTSGLLLEESVGNPIAEEEGVEDEDLDWF
jgi:hypothetical protein|tara:strand:+ start:902 stop:2131 length:1230 start_codon:yes stop_codon:yes gene_type:complete